MDKRQELAHEFCFECVSCGYFPAAPTSRKHHTGNPGRPQCAVNDDAVFAGRVAGVGRAKQQALLAPLGVDGLAHYGSWAANGAGIDSPLQAEVKQDVVLENRRAARAHALSIGAVADAEGKVPIVGSFDGSWGSRGHTSHTGQGAIEYCGIPGCVIAQVNKNKYCATCSWWEKYHNGWFLLDKPAHVCYRNYQGSPEGMEAEIAVELIQEVAFTYERYDESCETPIPIPAEERLKVEFLVYSDEDSSTLAQ